MSGVDRIYIVPSIVPDGHHPTAEFFFFRPLPSLELRFVDGHSPAFSVFTDDFGGSCPIGSASHCPNLAAIPFGGRSYARYGDSAWPPIFALCPAVSGQERHQEAQFRPFLLANL